MIGSSENAHGLCAVAVWAEHLGGLLSRVEVGELLNESESRVDEMVGERRLVILPRREALDCYPAFQLRAGRTIDSLVAAYWTLTDAGVKEWTAASWCVSRDGALGDASPVEWAAAGGSAERLAQVAMQDAARLAQ